MRNCRGCLKKIQNNYYCNACIKRVFRGKIPLFNISKSDFENVRYEFIDHFSLSGVQDKISLKLEKNKLQPTGKNGEYILKPIPANPVPRFQPDIPVNEHLTMQIARQIFKIKTAENALIPFSDGELAYVTKRFDRRNALKIRQEDFCQLSGKTPETAGENYRYDSSYQEAGEIVKRYCAAYKIEIEKLFSIILFNYLIGNGDAHLKNFSLLESISGDFMLSPAYDLINTNLHFPNESRLALDMFISYESTFYKDNGFHGKEDFIKLAEYYEIKPGRSSHIIKTYLSKYDEIKLMIKSSFLSTQGKEKYKEITFDRFKAMGK